MVMVKREWGFSLKDIEQYKDRVLRKYEINRSIQHLKYATRIAKRQLPLYSSNCSRKDFTFRQLYAILYLKQMLDVDYRGIIKLLEIYPKLRDAIGLKKTPHYSTLAHAFKRLPEKLCSSWR